MDHWLSRAAASHPERAAIGTLTYSDLDALARKRARALDAAGVREGDRVPLSTAEAQDFVIALHACLLLGAAVVPIDPRLSETERAARAAPGRVSGRGVATVMHTSGTTAEPRAVELTYGNWLANALGSAVALGLDLEERWLCPLPLAHVGGLAVVIRSAIYGTTAVLHERFDVEQVLGALMGVAQGITLVSLVPTMLSRLLDAGLSAPPTLRWVLLGGGPVAPALLEAAAAAGVPVAPTYGMTEACSQIATFGWPLPGVDVRVAADSEVLVRGPTVAADAIAADGWLHTGDLGVLDDRGRLSITARKSDVIITGGENVVPAEVEVALLGHPAVAEAAVHGRPDPEWGEAVVATVVLRDGAAVSAEGLREHCAAQIARHKVPKAIEFAPRLPRTASGKVLRSALR
jgi:O-succinylbenzoic acid--CoA ligase